MRPEHAAGGESARSCGHRIITTAEITLVHRPVLSPLGGLDESMLKRMRAVGLADGVGLAQTTLGEFLKREEAAMTGKPATRTFYGHTRRNPREHFGEGRLLRDIRNEDADGWRAWLVAHEKLSPATVARRVIAARTIWQKAVRWKLAEPGTEHVIARHRLGSLNLRQQFERIIHTDRDRW